MLAPVRSPDDEKIIGAIVAGYDLISQGIVPAFKERYGSEFTLFEKDLRIDTTLRDASGNLLTGSRIDNPEIVSAVLRQGNSFHGAAVIQGNILLSTASCLV